MSSDIVSGRLESIEQHFATKADLEAAMSELVRWVVGMSVVQSTVLVTLFGLAKSFHLI